MREKKKRRSRTECVVENKKANKKRSSKEVFLHLSRKKGNSHSFSNAGVFFFPTDGSFLFANKSAFFLLLVFFSRAAISQKNKASLF
jgi:hypothetical protein